MPALLLSKKVKLQGALPPDNKINITYPANNCSQFFHKPMKNSILIQKIYTFV